MQERVQGTAAKPPIPKQLNEGIRLHCAASSTQFPGIAVYPSSHRKHHALLVIRLHAQDQAIIRGQAGHPQQEGKKGESSINMKDLASPGVILTAASSSVPMLSPALLQPPGRSWSPGDR